MFTIRKLIIAFFVLFILFAPLSLAQNSPEGIVPSPTTPGLDCNKYVKTGTLKEAYQKKEIFQEAYATSENRGDLLGCAIRTGRIRLYMMPFFITYLVQFLLSVAGILAVLFVVLGGYWYVVGGLTEEKEKGKKFIQNALIGLLVALSAWIIVNFIQAALTS